MSLRTQKHNRRISNQSRHSRFRQKTINSIKVEKEPVPHHFLDNNEALPKLSSKSDLMSVGIPEKIITDYSKISTVNYHYSFATQQQKIFVTEVYSPYKFWFVLADDLKKLNVLMESIQQFYEIQDLQNDNPYKMNPNNVVLGRPCVALYNSIWHRAVIISPVRTESAVSKVTIRYFDYGTIATIPLEWIRFMLAKFAELPNITMRGRLALIAPRHNEKHWKHYEDVSATEAFLNLVFEKELNATLYAYEEGDKIYHLILHNVFLLKEYQIMSINQKLAFTYQCEFLTQKIERWPYVDELYPTFEMLEKNKFPTYTQLVKSKYPEIYFIKERTAPYYKDEHREKKYNQRIVYGYTGDFLNKSDLYEHAKVNVNNSFNFPRNESVSDSSKSFNARRLQSISTYKFSEVISSTINHFKNLRVSDESTNAIPVTPLGVFLKKMREWAYEH